MSQSNALHADLWYYQDNAGVQQGPMTTHQMRGWFDAGYLPVETLVAASFYGEVPEVMTAIAELWENPRIDAFGGQGSSVSATDPATSSALADSRSPHDSTTSVKRETTVGPVPKPGSCRRTPYDKPSGAAKEESSRRPNEKGRGGKGKGDRGRGGKGGGRGPPPHVLKYEAAKSAQLGLIGGAKAVGGGMPEQRQWKSPK